MTCQLIISAVKMPLIEPSTKNSLILFPWVIVFPIQTFAATSLFPLFGLFNLLSYDFNFLVNRRKEVSDFGFVLPGTVLFNSMFPIEVVFRLGTPVASFRFNQFTKSNCWNANLGRIFRLFLYKTMCLLSRTS